MKTSDNFVENLVNKKLLLAAFYQLTYQNNIIVKPKVTGSCGRGIRNEHMSNTNTILI